MAKPENPHHGHRERVYNRFLREGLDNFEEHQALELLLFFAKPRCDTNPLAHTLIEEFGGFAQVLDAPINQLMKIKGVGLVCAVLLKLIPAMGRYYYISRDKNIQQICSDEEAVQFFISRFHGYTEERFMVAFLDDKRKVLRCMTLAEGIRNAVAVNSSRIVTEAVLAGATNVILAHDHPGGVALPSDNDLWLTAQIARMLQTVNISLCDHVIISEGDGISFASSGCMPRLRDIRSFSEQAASEDMFLKGER